MIPETPRMHRRFDRMGRLVGDRAMAKLLSSHVMVVGLGGVGSWAAEALARSGVGKLTLVDFDEVCITNFNRQLHALQGFVGTKKVEPMAERLLKIHPQMGLRVIPKFYNDTTASEIFEKPVDFVLDAIDNVTAKCHLIAECRKRQIPVLVATGSGGRIDPLQVRVRDLGLSQLDPLARSVRRVLRQSYGFPSKGVFGVPAIVSTEAPRMPEELEYDKGEGFKCVCPQGNNPYFQCDNRNLIHGNAGFLTGSFGLVAASYIVRSLVGELPLRETLHA